MILSSNYYFLIFVILVHFWTFVHVLFTQQWISNVFNLQSVGKHLTTFLVLHVSNHKKKVCVGFSCWKDLHTEQFTVMPRGYRFSGVGDNSILGSLWTGVCVCVWTGKLAHELVSTAAHVVKTCVSFSSSPESRHNKISNPSVHMSSCILLASCFKTTSFIVVQTLQRTIYYFSEINFSWVTRKPDYITFLVERCVQ